MVKLSGKCISELFSIAILLPLAASNLKSQISGKVVASDASNWGQAAVVADVPGKVAEELYRHCLRKSVWTRLLGPAAEWRRGMTCWSLKMNCQGMKSLTCTPFGLYVLKVSTTGCCLQNETPAQSTSTSQNSEGFFGLSQESANNFQATGPSMDWILRSVLELSLKEGRVQGA